MSMTDKNLFISEYSAGAENIYYENAVKVFLMGSGGKTRHVRS